MRLAQDPVNDRQIDFMASNIVRESFGLSLAFDDVNAGDETTGLSHAFGDSDITHFLPDPFTHSIDEGTRLLD